MDGEKLGLWPGLFLRFASEGRYGRNILGRAGTFMPVNNDALFPADPDHEGKDVFALTEVNVTQFLTPWFGIFAGLLNTTSGDANDFAGFARSNRHFQNLSFLVSPVSMRFIPNVTLGGGIVLIPHEKLVLNHSGLPIQLVVASGGDDERYAELQQLAWHRPAHVYNFVKNMPTMMRAADCIICKAGGLTVTESLACGLPLMLTDVIPGQETGNAEYVINGGAGEMIDEPLKALETVRHWLLNDGQLLKERSANAAKLGRPRAAYDIVDRAWTLAQRGPVEKEAEQILILPRLIEMFMQFGVKVEE